MVDVINPQTQTRVVWADSPDVAQAYLDQLTRSGSVEAALAAQVHTAIDQWRAGGSDARGSRVLAGSLSAAAGKTRGTDAARLTALAGLFQRRAG